MGCNIKARNKKELLSQGKKLGRKIALDIIEHVTAVDSYDAVKEFVHVNGGRLFVGSLKYQLSRNWKKLRASCRKRNSSNGRSAGRYLGKQNQ